MLILLPPSEGKAESGRGRPLDLAKLSMPALTEPRELVLDALVSLCAHDDADRARRVLGLSPGLHAEVRRNARLRQAGALPVGRLYTGVLYDALDLASLDPAAQRRAARSVVVFSALWGAVRVTDRVPPYRCAATVNLPEIGGLAAHWRRALAEALAEAAGDRPVLDLRSTAYASMWAPAGAAAARTVVVRVLHERVEDGVTTRSVVSHFNKATKGRLVRDLLMAGAAPRSTAALVEALRDLKYTVDEQPVRPGAPRQLDVVVAHL